MTLEEFITQSKDWKFPRGMHVTYPGFATLYVRRGVRFSSRTNQMISTFELARLEADNPGGGLLTELLDILRDENVLVECVSSERLERGLERRGFVRLLGTEGFPSYLLERTTR